MCCQSGTQSCQCQLRVKCAAQTPAPDRSRKDIYDDGQVHVLLVQANVGDITDPYLIWACDIQLFDQVGEVQQQVVIMLELLDIHPVSLGATPSCCG